VPENDRGIVALEGFDHKMARSVELLQKKGFWDDLVDCGGSREYILSMPASEPALVAMGSIDKRALQSELNEHSKKSQEIRSSLSRLPSRIGIIRTLSAFTESGEPLFSFEATDLYFAGTRITVDNDYVSDYVFGWHMVDFWTNICLCHSLIIETRELDDGTVEKVYQGPSPDEVALVEAARNVGFVFRERTNTGIMLDMLGHEVQFEVLNVMEFSSERKRMSVVARSRDGTLRVFCKGADNIMLSLLKKDLDRDLIASTHQSLHDYSVKGLRTLVLGTRILDTKEFEEWDAKYQAAARSLSEDRETKINEIAKELERDFELVGITAIEDKLQEGVPLAIETLRMAGIKVWMITGDKMETAINIGISCNLISTHDVPRLVADSHEQADQELSKLQREVEHMDESSKPEIVVDGPSLTHILGDALFSIR